MRKHATYVPGFKFADMAGGNLSVVGFLKPTTSEEQVKEFDLSQFSSTFYTKILNKAINSMPVSTRTRTNNLTNTSRQSHSVPKFYRLYLEDISALSNKIKHLSLALDATHPYTYDFAFYLFGQQVLQDFPLTLATTKLSDTLFDESMIEIASIHYAINLSHVDPNFTVFWGTERTSAYLSGARTQKHPIFGLYQIANITSAKPRNLTHLISPTDDTAITYAQAYTTFIKGLCGQRPLSTTLFF